jgi:hypothetical protein
VLRRGAQFVVYRDEALLVQPHAGGVQLQVGGDRLSADGDQQLVGGDLGVVGEDGGDRAVGIPGHPADRDSGAHVDALAGEDFRHRGGDVRVFPAEQLGVTLQHRDPGADGVQDLGELPGDVPTAEDVHAPR